MILNLNKTIFWSFCIVCLLACKVKNEQYYIINETSVNTSKLVLFDKELDYQNRFALKIVNDNKVLFNLSKKKQFLLFDLIKGSVDTISTNLNDVQIDAVKYNSTNSVIAIKNNFFWFDYSKKKLELLGEIKMDKDDFIIHNLYSEAMYQNNNFYFLQCGNANTYNRLSENAFLFFNKDTSFKAIPTASETKENYIHYNDICIDFLENDYYYSYATIPKIYKYDAVKGRVESSSIESSGYLNFDTTKLTDVKYIFDYTTATTYNVKLLTVGSKIVLVQRSRKNEEYYYSLFIFDKTLKLLSKSKIEHNVDVNFIFSCDNKLIFLTTKDKKMYEYTIY
jgi:hypothetical protein